MGKRKRTSRRTDLVGRAVSAGRRALKEAEGRVPPDLRRRVERSLKDADRTARAAIKTLQTQVRRASTRADVNSVLKRIDGLTRQARQIARGAGSRPAPARRAATTTRRTASRTKKAAPTRRAATRRTATAPAAKPRRASTPRRPRAARTVVAEPPDMVMPVAEIDEIEIVEIEP